jgi:hypothetical protein
MRWPRCPPMAASTPSEAGPSRTPRCGDLPPLSLSSSSPLSAFFLAHTQVFVVACLYVDCLSLVALLYIYFLF